MAFWFPLILIISSIPLSLAHKLRCSDLAIASAPIIPRNPDADQKKHEFVERGILLTGEAPLKDLKEGRYVFIITADKKIYYEEAVPQQPIEILENKEAPLFVSHRSLMAHAGREAEDTPIRIVAAGEWIVSLDANGKKVVSELNNKSNTFRSGDGTIPLMELALTDYGLPITPRTKRVNYATYNPNKHLIDQSEAKLWIKYQSHPELDLLKELNQKLLKQYSEPGYDTLDLNRLADALRAVKAKRIEVGDKKGEKECDFWIFWVKESKDHNLPYILELLLNKHVKRTPQNALDFFKKHHIL